MDFDFGVSYVSGVVRRGKWGFPDFWLGGRAKQNKYICVYLKLKIKMLF